MTRKQAHAILPGEYGWRGYLKAASMGNDELAGRARLLHMLGGTRPHATRLAIAMERNRGNLTEEEYHDRLKSVDVLFSAWQRGVGTHVVDTTEWKTDYTQLGNGGHLRREHHAGGVR